MSRRFRYSDTKNAGTAKHMQRVEGESWRQRHERRKATNLQRQDEVAEWCSFNGIKFDVRNKGHHWEFRAARRIIEWWPSTAKLVIDRQYKDGVHTHDWQQVIDIVKREFLGGDDATS